MSDIRTTWILIAILLTAGCATQPQKLVCNAPYILVGTACCVDQNNSSICDKDESQGTNTVSEIQTKTDKAPKSYLDDSSIKEAIELGKTHKFDPLVIFYKFDNNKYEPLGISTPYSLIAFASALKAKDYEELTDDEIGQIIRSDLLIIDVNVVGYTSYEVKQAKAVLKYDDNVIKSSSARSNPDVDCSGAVCKWDGIVDFSFPNFSSIRDKEVKFVLILLKEEREYALNLSQYK